MQPFPTQGKGFHAKLNTYTWFVLQKRQILVTIIEICLPLLFAAILIALRHRVQAVDHPNATTYHSLPVSNLPVSPHWRPYNLELAYVPANNTAVKSIVETVAKALEINTKGQELGKVVCMCKCLLLCNIMPLLSTGVGHPLAFFLSLWL